ncbi:MAG TPA: RHS repeat-associated core domain-containing protein, partial [Gemmatimonadaceae bacterium]|nr:RHS repeat-associated core domain-containing protein [Gemmatimonadaceae bacterium]
DPIGGEPRLTVAYGSTATDRDRATLLQTSTGEKSGVTYSTLSAETSSPLGQVRSYELTAQPKEYAGDRSHVAKVTERAVVTASGVGELPAGIAPGGYPTQARDRVTSFTYHEEGMVLSSRLEGVRESTTTYQDVNKSGANGFIVQSIITKPLISASAKRSSNPVSSLVAQSLGEAITLTPTYQTSTNASTFVDSISANGLEVVAPEAHRGNSTDPEHPLTVTNSSVTTETLYGDDGLILSMKSHGGNDGGTGESFTKVTYKPIDAAPFERALPSSVDNGGVASKIDYGLNTVTETDERDVVTRTTFDTWRRPISIHVEKPDDSLKLDETYQYDANGRLSIHTRQQDLATVATTFEYDALGRRTKVTTDNIAVDGVKTSLSTTTAYDIPNHRIVTTAPSGAISTTELDALGRVVRSATSTNSSDPIETRVAYDADDNVVYSTDMLTASGAAFDVHGRQLLSQASDGTQSVTTYDAWGHPKSVIAYDSASQKIAGGTLDFTADGRLNKTTTEVDALLSRSTDFRWDGGGRTSAIATSGRASKTEYDLAGRVKKAQAGKGTTTAISDVFSSADVSAYSGYLPTATKTAEKGSAGYESTTSYDSAGNATLQQLGNLEWKQTFDEAGNIKSASQPGRSAANYDHDARGALLTETMPDGAALQNRFDKNGSQTEYKDPTGQKTIDTTDLVGRPLTRTYPDSTTEVYTYERSRIKTYKDRQNRTKVYGYNNRGQLTDIHFQGDVTLDHFDYDPAGRLLAWTNKDASIAWSDFTRDGNPQKTTQTRYKNGSGLGSREVLDEFVQDHKWNEHGERIEWSMPHATSTTAPPLLAPWTDRLSASYDAMGNVDGVERKLAGGGGFSALLTSHSRNSGRPDSRTITSSCGSAPCSAGSILRSYTYDSTTGQLNGMRVTSNGLIVAGALITHFDGLQLSEQQLLGVSNDSRFSHWTYDARSRLATTTIGRALEQKLTQSDFREKLVREPRFDEATRAAMAAKGIAVQRLDPPTQTATETPAAHKIASIAQGSEARTFTYNGAERSGDARFDYEWDEKGRLVRATQHIGDPAPPAIMRVSYVYDGRDRMVGRRVEIAQTSSPATWQPAPSAVLTDGIPAEATIVWDPISDTIAAVYDSNTGALVRQVINGSLSYDDPLEVTVAQASSSPNPQSPILRLYPIYDESGTGNLQAVLNSSGEVVSRNIVDDAYGEETFSLGGAAIDRVAVTATKKSSGALDSVEVTMRSTEPLRPSTLAIGTRLAVVDAGGAVVRSSNATPQLFDNNYAVRWTLTAAEWQTLTVDGAALSIAATKNLRASTFNAETPVLPAPNWATATRPIFTTSEVPVEVRESLAALSTFLASIPSGDKTETLYEAKDLALAGSDKQSDDPSRFLLNAAFQAVPFFDSVTRHSYVRARWLDHATGTWLSPDPLGYRDSSNLYAFAGGDPVNRRDPSGSNWTVGSSALKIVEETEWAIKGVEAGVEVAEVSAAVSPVGVGIVLFEGGRWAISKYAEHVEAKADSYVDEQLQFANEIKTRARKRRNSGQIIVPRMPGVTPWSQQTQLLPPGSAAARQADIQHNEQVGAPDKKAKNRWQYIREWHDKRATDIFGPGLGRRVGTRADGNLRTYDKYYRDYDVEYKSDNFSKAPRAPQRISDLTRQIQKDITNKGLGLANPYWHFEHDPRVAREMDPLLRALDDAGIPWGVGPEPMIFQQ